QYGRVAHRAGVEREQVVAGDARQRLVAGTADQRVAQAQTGPGAEAVDEQFVGADVEVDDPVGRERIDLDVVQSVGRRHPIDEAAVARLEVVVVGGQQLAGGVEEAQHRVDGVDGPGQAAGEHLEVEDVPLPGGEGVEIVLAARTVGARVDVAR